MKMKTQMSNSSPKVLNPNLMVSASGDLLRLSDFQPIRTPYSYTFADLSDDPFRLKLRATLRNGKFAWPGGYPMFLLFQSGEPLCFDCAIKHYHHLNPEQWGAIVGTQINWEDEHLTCSHCNQKIESAYGE